MNINDPSPQELLSQAVRKESRKGIQRAIELGADANRVSIQDIRSVEILEYLQELGLEMSLEKYGGLLLSAIQGPEYAVVWRPNMELIYYIDNIMKGKDFYNLYDSVFLPAYEISLERGYDSIVKIIEKYMLKSTESELLLMAALFNNKEVAERLSNELRLPEQLRDQLSLLMVEYGLSNNASSTDLQNFKAQVDQFIIDRREKAAQAIIDHDVEKFLEAVHDGINVCNPALVNRCIYSTSMEILWYIITNPNCIKKKQVFLDDGLLESIIRHNAVTAEFFLEKGANPHAVLSRPATEGARTFLEVAITHNEKHIVKLLLNYETDIDPKLIKLAQRLKRNNIIRLLLQKQAELTGEKIRDIPLENDIEEKAEGRSEERVERYCKQDRTIQDNEPLYDDITVLFFIAGNRNARAECYSKAELKEIFSHAAPVYEMDGPPLGFGSGGYRGPRGPNEANPVYKLPWTGIWVDKTIPELVDNGTSVILLHPELKSIGSGHGVGQMAGQWGGHWAKNGDDAMYIEAGDAQPDERETVYYGTPGWLD